MKKKVMSVFAKCVRKSLLCISEDCIFSATPKFFNLNFT